MDQDVELFCKDLGATVRQTVDLARGVEENCFNAVQNALPPAPWIAELNSKAQSCVEQHKAERWVISLWKPRARRFSRPVP